MFIATAGSTSVGNMLFYSLGVKARKVTEGCVLGYDIRGIRLKEDKNKQAPVSVWEVSDEDAKIYDKLNEDQQLLKRNAYINGVKALVYFAR